MFVWWNSLSLASQIFVLIALPSTGILLIQTILMLIGIGSDSDVDVDGDIDIDADVEIESDGVFGSGEVEGDIDPTGLDALRVFTVRGIIAFLVVFGWTGFMLDRAGMALWTVIPIAAIAGFIMMYILALLMRAVMKLRNDGNIDNKNALGTSGRVYLTIPPTRSGEGKVNVLLQGSYVERDAVTDEENAIPTGAEIVVVGLSGQTTLVVKRK
ncbi:MAG: hypothetical protein E7615_04235 [Ruminococcaceae bacterium]|nr:hypothetical protein [Oscillospiraceae bacterium]